ncbi:hypothetical protein BpHYR1_005371 [Brachionus plicatilis]|uniref:Uncharacterized protein n=1 Tax=Brachionus plicatilis TaxID=10195 RepID=A0A3M7PL95_BRAPC|nr:hypothetical protein BpHYR1_005371 [Brachionus plicatilis]
MLDAKEEKTVSFETDTSENAKIISQNPNSNQIEQYRSLNNEQLKDEDIKWMIDLKKNSQRSSLQTLRRPVWIFSNAICSSKTSSRRSSRTYPFFDF